MYNLSSYLTLRFDYNSNWTSKTGLNSIKVYNEQDTLENLIKILKKIKKQYSNKLGILLSSGIDSIILAKFLPNINAYTIKFMAPNALDESIEAAKFAKICKLNHKIITVTWENYKNNIEFLCKKFNRPLHPIEIALYLTSKQAKKDGIDYLVSGCGADSNFGGIDKLLSVNWTYEDFKKRYTFVPPEKVLKPQYIQSIDYVFKKYKINNSIDVFQFVEAIMGQEHSLYFDNPINLGGCKLLAPHNMLKFSTPLDLNRIKNGEPKYILRNIFKQLFPNIEIPKKIAFARPMDSWMQFYIKSNRPEYLDNLDLNQFTGEQKWLIYCLEQYLNYKDKND